MKHIHTYFGKDERNMKEYKKPLVTVDAGLAEGVYMKSGNPNSYAYTIKMTSQGNEWYKSDQYELNFISYEGNGPYTATAVLTVTGTGIDSVSVTTGNGSATLDGDKITVMLNGWSTTMQLLIKYSSRSFSIS